MNGHDTYADRFRDLLHTAPVPAPRVDLDQVVDAGRRRRRMRRVTTSALAAAAVALVAVASVVAVNSVRPTVPGPPGGSSSPSVAGWCTVRTLPSPPPVTDDSLHVTDIDPSGRYITGNHVFGAGATPLLWVAGQLRVLDAPGADPRAVAVNSAGTVIVAENAFAGPVWIHSDGRYSALPGGTEVAATAINAGGDVVGVTSREGVAGRDAVIWPADRPGEIRVLSGGSAVATGISDDGLIVGYEDGPTANPPAARLWNRDGTAHAQPPGFETMLVAGSWMVGTSGAGAARPGPTELVLLNVTTGERTLVYREPNRDPTGPSLTNYFRANDLSETGVIVGALVANDAGLPAIFRDGLTAYLPLPPGRFEAAEARGVSADGRVVVGSGTRIVTRDGDRGHEAMALLWTC